jgi:hypothetical protein
VQRAPRYIPAAASAFAARSGERHDAAAIAFAKEGVNGVIVYLNEHDDA